MKRAIAIIVSLVMIIGLMTGCGGNTDDKTQDGKINIVTTIYPIYDWVNSLVGENEDIDVTLLLDDGVDLHSFQPTADDIIKISDSDMFIYVGGESDGWVEDIIKDKTNENMVALNLMEILGDNVKAEEHKEGMEETEHHHHHDDEDEHHDEHEHEHEHEHDEDEHHDEHEHEHDADEHEHEHDEDEHHDEHDHEHDEDEHHDEDCDDEGCDHEGHHHNDEHVWLSLKNAKIICEEIAESLNELNKEKDYAQNAESYITKLEELDKQYEEVIETSDNDTILFGDRFPFRYMVEDYDIDYFAAFSGCSAESEASFETITFLAKKVDELGLPVVICIEKPTHKIAQTIVDNTKEKNQKILYLNSMQTVTNEDVESGDTYLSIMADNLKVIEEALK